MLLGWCDVDMSLGSHVSSVVVDVTLWGCWDLVECCITEFDGWLWLPCAVWLVWWLDVVVVKGLASGMDMVGLVVGESVVDWSGLGGDVGVGVGVGVWCIVRVSVASRWG